MELATGDAQEIMAARITTLGADILQQTNGHNHAVNPTTTRVDCEDLELL